eukprot:643140-Ditylum_brightwellii.AAC.1
MEGTSRIVTKLVTTTPAKKEVSNSTLSTAVAICSFNLISMENALRSNAKREHVGIRNSKPVFTGAVAIFGGCFVMDCLPGTVWKNKKNACVH